MKTNSENAAEADPRRKTGTEATRDGALRTKNCVLLSSEAEAALLAEAEAGYDPEGLVPRRATGGPSPERAGS
ncbi:hypothetical protein [Actinoplanes friuliensis]|uniref:hypothetical protein n=1 Tax=Actinoplanes friuliensis TaxID=196914 RepID=UPI0011DDA60F|nr:hypothetical protein [Actinoplanes friuliensis]